MSTELCCDQRAEQPARADGVFMVTCSCCPRSCTISSTCLSWRLRHSAYSWWLILHNAEYSLCVFVNWFVTSFLLAVCLVLGKWSHGDKHRDILVLNMVWSLFRNDRYCTQTMTRTNWNTHVHKSHCFLSYFNLQRLKDGGIKWLGETWPVNLLYLSTCLSSPVLPPVKRCRLSAFPASRVWCCGLMWTDLFILLDTADTLIVSIICSTKVAVHRCIRIF